MNVLILGSGFSFPAGLPGAEDFVPRVGKQWGSIVRTAGLSSKEAARYRERVDDLWNERGRPDIETLLVSAESSPTERMLVARFIKIGISGISRRYIREELRRVDRRTLDVDFDGFARYVEIRRPTILSFNYDMICEYLIREVLGMRDDHGIGFDRTGDPGSSDPPTAPEGRPLDSGWRRPSNRERVIVLKPFGSVSWTLCPSCGFAVDHARHVTDRLLTSPPECERCKGIPEPLIVSPTMSEARRDDIPQLRETWKQAERALRSADSVCVCGYSGRGGDGFFDGLLKRTVGEARKLRKLALVNPDEKARIRLRKIFKAALGVEPPTGGKPRKKPEWKVPRAAQEPDLVGAAEDSTPGDGDQALWLSPEPDPPTLACEELDTFADWLSGDEVR